MTLSASEVRDASEGGPLARYDPQIRELKEKVNTLSTTKMPLIVYMVDNSSRKIDAPTDVKGFVSIK